MNLPQIYSDLTPYEKRAVREKYVEVQKGICPYCNSPLGSPPLKMIMSKKINLDLFPPNFLKHPIHLHHDHDTGLTIGAIHAYCNAVSWQYDGI